MKLTQVVKQQYEGTKLGHSYLVYLSYEQMEELERIARERFTSPDKMKVQDMLRYIVQRFIEERPSVRP